MRVDRYGGRQPFWALIAVNGGLTASIRPTESPRTVGPRTGGLLMNRGHSFLGSVGLTRLPPPVPEAANLSRAANVATQFIYQRRERLPQGGVHRPRQPGLAFAGDVAG